MEAEFSVAFISVKTSKILFGVADSLNISNGFWVSCCKCTGFSQDAIVDRFCWRMAFVYGMEMHLENTLTGKYLTIRISFI